MVLALLFVLACHIGGTVATDTFPVQIDTDHYSMRASLDLAPSRWSQLRAFTTVGDVTLDFRSILPAPGVEVSPQIKKSILGSVTGGGFSASSLVPSPAEIDSAGRAAVIGLVVTYLVGALLVAAIVLLVSHTHWSRHRRRAVIAGGTAVLAALAYTAGSAASTYRPGRVSTYSSTQLLALLQSSPQVLTSIEARAGQVEPYITNWLELQQALQQHFVAPEVAKADTVRFLLVSDIHGTNEYQTMKKIVTTEDITAVIDTGDLLNFGRVDEAEIAGIFAGIASLKVPYIFVTGNHDADSPTNQSLLKRLAQVKNVLLPEPVAGDYRVLSIAGVRIAGMDDPRYWSDSNSDFAAIEGPAAEKFDAALKDVPDLDIAIAHEPTATDKITVGALRIHGHLHRATLDGNVIGVGTFTGGGLVSYYRNSIESGAAEPTGQPQAFDILRYNADCSVNSLQRFVYSDLLEGSPKYDSISIINGASLPVPAPAEGRRCVTTEPAKDMSVQQAIDAG